MTKYLLMLFALSFSGCCLHGPGIIAARDGFKVIHAEYDAYLAADPMLDAAQKDNRKATADTLEMLLNEMAKEPTK